MFQYETVPQQSLEVVQVDNLAPQMAVPMGGSIPICGQNDYYMGIYPYNLAGNIGQNDDLNEKKLHNQPILPTKISAFQGLH